MQPRIYAPREIIFNDPASVMRARIADKKPLCVNCPALKVEDPGRWCQKRQEDPAPQYAFTYTVCEDFEYGLPKSR